MNKTEYRAWIMCQQRMVRVAGLNFGNPIQIEVPRIGKENTRGRAWDNPDNFEFWFEGKEAILMQYVGLKDKNRKKMYEGDIIRRYVGAKFIGIAPIVFGNHNVGKDSWGIHLNCQGFFEEWQDGSGYSALDDGKDCRVIGNIYENPDLLEKP